MSASIFKREFSFVEAAVLVEFVFIVGLTTGFFLGAMLGRLLGF